MQPIIASRKNEPICPGNSLNVWANQRTNIRPQDGVAQACASAFTRVYSAVQPPSSTSAEPVISDEASEARNTIAPVSSSN